MQRRVPRNVKRLEGGSVCVPPVASITTDRFGNLCDRLTDVFDSPKRYLTHPDVCKWGKTDSAHRLRIEKCPWQTRKFKLGWFMGAREGVDQLSHHA